MSVIEATRELVAALPAEARPPAGLIQPGILAEMPEQNSSRPAQADGNPLAAGAFDMTLSMGSDESNLDLQDLQERHAFRSDQASECSSIEPIERTPAGDEEEADGFEEMERFGGFASGPPVGPPDSEALFDDDGGSEGDLPMVHDQSGASCHVASECGLRRSRSATLIKNWRAYMKSFLHRKTRISALDDTATSTPLKSTSSSAAFSAVVPSFPREAWRRPPLCGGSSSS
mmetsp:Transcript_105951/g.274155  ORF Transcript_105951/g.274155 Transcript_105951/m.274155 type:complete len:231 (-) Transcript_105951:33-725(-)